jgi:glucose/arabinose dehydrogenase
VARWRKIGGGVAAALCIAGTACDGGGSHDGGGGVITNPSVDFAPAFGGISFDNPVKLVQHPTNADRWYVVEQGGLVKTFLASNPSGSVATAADVDALVNLGSGGEQGLLGMAIDPNFASSDEVYFTYTDEGTNNSVLARWVSDDSGLTFTPDSPSLVLAIAHPLANHNGGDIMFGPDGFLYYSMGDGGGADDPDNNGQNPRTLLGKILRLDVNGGTPYAIPPGNPNASNPNCTGGSGSLPCPEIYALGMRNPWRMNFDPSGGKLYVGDVGQGAREEIDILTTPGANYGWDCLEGDLAHTTSATCNFGTFTAPEVVHGRTEARAITGGAVYRGSAVASLRGFYVYGDFLTGLFFAFDVSVPDAPVQRLALPVTSVSAFGQGRDGEVYVVSFGSPSIQRFVPSSG